MDVLAALLWIAQSRMLHEPKFWATVFFLGEFLAGGVALVEKRRKLGIAAIAMASLGLFCVGLFWPETLPLSNQPTTSIKQEGTTANSSNIVGNSNTVNINPAPSPVPAPLSALFVECHMVQLPIAIPPGITIHLIGANQHYMKSERCRFFDIPNDSDKGLQWPDEKTKEEKLKKLSGRAKHTWELGKAGYRCEVSNHGPDNVLYLDLRLDFWFENNKVPVRCEPIIPSLDVNKVFSFYVFNDCPADVSAAWQEIAKVETVREPQMHNIELLREHRDLIDQIMMFFPAQVQWVGQQPCH